MRSKRAAQAAIASARNRGSEMRGYTGDDYQDEGDPFECDECGGKIYRNCVDFDGVCDLCKLEEKAQRQLLNLNEKQQQKVKEHMNTHPYIAVNNNFDANCSKCEGKKRDYVHHYADLKSALLDLGKANYEKERAFLIGCMGYDGFRELQNEVFKEIGTIQFEKSQSQASG
jgi:hypothetical protein